MPPLPIAKSHVEGSPVSDLLRERVGGVLRQPHGLTDNDLVAFWAVVRPQLDRWQFILVAACETADRVGVLKPEAVTTCQRTAEAVFQAEPLLRAWTAVLCEFDARRQLTWRPLALKALEMLLATRLSALRLMTHVQALPPSVASDLDRVRRRCERRVDWVLAMLADEVDATHFCFSAARVRDFAVDAIRIGADPARQTLAGATARSGLPSEIEAVLRASLTRQHDDA